MGYLNSISTPSEPPPRKKSRWQRILKLFLGLGLILFILSIVDFEEVRHILLHLNPWFLLVVVGVFYLERAIMAYKWQALLGAVNIEAPFSLLFQIYTTVPIVGTLLPSSIGGDIYRFFSLSRLKASAKAVLASMVVERLIATVATLLLTTLSLALAFYLMRDRWRHLSGVTWSLVIGGALFAVLVGVVYLSLKIDLYRLAGRYTKYSLVRKLLQLYKLSVEYRNHLPILWRVSVWSFLVQFAPIIKNMLIVLALGIHVSLLEIMVIIPIIILAGRLPISIEGLGVREGLYVALFGLVGVSASEAFLLSTMTRIVELLSALPWGLHYLLYDRHKIVQKKEPFAE